MVVGSRLAVCVMCALGLLFSADRAGAEPTADDLAQAKLLFKQGNELRKAGDCERALERFAASRALVPSVPNILNSAYCLNALGRADEALDDYALLLTDFKADLEPQEVEDLTRAMAQLRDKVGGIEVAVNVPDATLVVDGKPRGTLPRVVPVRVLPGEHRVLVLRDGYGASDNTVKVEAGRTAEVRATLSPLAIAGRVRIDAPELAGAEIVIDGAPIGKVPWEGALGAGVHWFALSRDGLGSLPTNLVVVDGQTAVVAATLKPLGPQVDIVARPSDARLSIGDVDVGVARFRTRLPQGVLHLSARAEGYLPYERALSVDANGPRSFDVELTMDPAHPRWRAAAKPLHWLLELHGGPSFGPGFGSGAEASCAGDAICSHRTVAVGGEVELRGGLRLPNGLSFELALGYLAARRSLARKVARPFASTDAEYVYTDRLGFLGPFAALGVGFVLPFGRFEPRAHVFAGVLYANARDDVSATATAGHTSVNAMVEGAGTPTHSVDIFVRPEIGVGLRAGGFSFGLDVGASVFLLNGPPNANGNTIVSESAKCAGSVGSIYCAPFQTAVASERSYRAFVLVSPTASIGYVF